MTLYRPRLIVLGRGPAYVEGGYSASKAMIRERLERLGLVVVDAIFRSDHATGYDNPPRMSLTSSPVPRQR